MGMGGRRQRHLWPKLVRPMEGGPPSAPSPGPTWSANAERAAGGGRESGQPPSAPSTGVLGRPIRKIER